MDGYFGRREGDCKEAGDECCGNRWEPVEQGDGFLDDEIMEIMNEHLVDKKRVWRSGTFLHEDPYDGTEEFWVVM